MPLLAIAILAAFAVPTAALAAHIDMAARVGGAELAVPYDDWREPVVILADGAFDGASGAAYGPASEAIPEPWRSVPAAAFAATVESSWAAAAPPADAAQHAMATERATERATEPGILGVLAAGALALVLAGRRRAPGPFQR